jgi:hypothetical protein
MVGKTLEGIGDHSFYPLYPFNPRHPCSINPVGYLCRLWKEK